MDSVSVWADEQLLDQVSTYLGTAWNVQRLTPEAQVNVGDVALVHGFEAAKHFCDKFVGTGVLVVAEPEELEALDESSYDFVCRPFSPEELRLRVRQLAGKGLAGINARVLSQAVEFAGDIVEIGTTNAVLQYVNPAFSMLMGIPAKEAVGKTPAQLVRSDAHPPEFFQELDRTLKAGKVWSGLLISRTRKGDLVHLESTIAPVADGSGKTTHHVAVKRDVTDRIKKERALQDANQALRKARDAALQASKAKSEFLANMSHELRTPLNAVIGYSELLMEDAEAEGNESLLEDLRKIHRSGTHLLGLINDVLDMSKIESGKMELELAQIDLPSLLETIHSTIEPQAKARGNTVILDAADAPPSIVTDPQKLSQILLNLLSNSSKFTQDGQIDLTVTSQEGGWLCFEVRDTGIGMSKEQRERIFRPFVQADTSTTRKYGGTGLGLSISARLCEMMGGSIEVESEEGKGSLFKLVLPTTVSPSRRAPALRSPESKISVLVIDNEQTTYDALSTGLSQRGFSVDWTASGSEGLLVAKDAIPQVIVLDVTIEDTDGWKLLAELKEDPVTQDIPVVMVTQTNDAEVGIAMGAVDYLIKPVKAPRLVDAVARWLGGPSTDNTANVLVVEDDDSLREIAERTLSAAGYHVSTAPNGTQALAAIDALRPDLILLDLMMPEMDGFEFLHHLRNRPGFKGTPVVVSTAKELTVEERESLQRSTQRVIQKTSYTRAQLLALVERQVTQLLTSARDSMAPAPALK